MLHQERVIISIRTEIAVKFLCFSVGRLVIAVSGRGKRMQFYYTYSCPFLLAVKELLP